MTYAFRLPDLGEGIHEAEILEVNVHQGDHVAEGDDVLVAETDKAAVDIPSPVTGDVVEIKVSAGDLVEVGEVLIVFEEDKAAAKGSGAPAAAAPEPAGGERVLATPAVRGLARELGVDLSGVAGSGPQGRVLEDDVRAAAGSEGGEFRRESLRSIRRATARRTSRSWREIPHAVHDEAIEITALERLRREHEAEAAKAGGKLTLTPFLLKALAGALSERPRFNATFDTERDELTIWDRIDIGVAIDTEHGLLVPVIRDVGAKGVLALAAELNRLAETLRHGRAEGDILKGGTFTLTNVGAIGGTGLSPLINPPQVAIFGAARAELRCVARGDLDEARMETALVLPVCVAFDHRVLDGADAAHFMNAVKALLGAPDELLRQNA